MRRASLRRNYQLDTNEYDEFALDFGTLVVRLQLPPEDRAAAKFFEIKDSTWYILHVPAPVLVVDMRMTDIFEPRSLHQEYIMLPPHLLQYS